MPSIRPEAHRRFDVRIPHPSLDGSKINTVPKAIQVHSSSSELRTIVFMSGQPTKIGDREELFIFVERLTQFINLWTVYTDLLTGKYTPSLNLFGEECPTGMQSTLMFILYAYFFSLMEDSSDGLNAFRIWREHFPEEEAAIAAVESRVMPFKNGLRVFRNRLAFHGSRSRSHEAPGLNVFANHSGTEVWEGMKLFKSLGAALLAKDGARQGLQGSDPERARRWIDSVTRKALQSKP
jgi:hypothetical protein